MLRFVSADIDLVKLERWQNLLEALEIIGLVFAEDLLNCVPMTIDVCQRLLSESGLEYKMLGNADRIWAIAMF